MNALQQGQRNSAKAKPIQPRLKGFFRAVALMQKGDNAKCERCNAEAKISLPYGPHNFCKEHFVRFFERRFKYTVQHNKLIKYGEKICVGVSGGKDSMATLHLLNKFYGKTGLNKIEAIMVDEGIKGYREKAIKIAVKYCTANKIPFHIVKFENELNAGHGKIDMGKVMEKIKDHPSLGGTCSFCGVFRRKFLNEKSLERGADKLATGHNLDDEVQSIVMSLFGSDPARLSRLGPSTGEKKKWMVPRIKPLYETPEKDIIAYCAFEGIEHYSGTCCPYSWMAKRNYYRKMLNEMEEEFPGTKYGVLGTYRKMKPLFVSHEKEFGGKIRECKSCGEPSNQPLCGTCRQLEKLLDAGKPTGKLKTRGKKGPSCAETKGK
ncbi:tRNA 2-thiocytidine biosynthesis protein TtcA [uncultured archaeon]|nr:tRNA 2-thiocytidine biosynthesis protein TtcA [uncultured archaeon]